MESPGGKPKLACMEDGRAVIELIGKPEAPEAAKGYPGAPTLEELLTGNIELDETDWEGRDSVGKTGFIGTGIAGPPGPALPDKCE